MEQLGVHSGANSWDMETHGVLLIVAMYLAFVLWLGPAAMKNRPPYKLTRTLLVYNGAQVVVSAYLAIISFREILQFGFLPRKCYMEEHWNLVNLRNQLYCIAKISELLDTIFFVLRKKNSQITFLHVYHHTGMVFSWVIFKNHPSHLSVFVRCINSFVHVVMYAYYGLAALGPHVAQYLKWKKYLTSLQLVVFGIWLYFAAKITELLDTVFFVLRKKDNQVTFLHLYHHSIMMIGCWGFFKYTPSHTTVFIGFLNSLVHVFMYTYYGLAALGPNVAKYLTWKKYMTTFQLVQFVSVIAQYIATVRVSECPPSKGVAIFILSNTVFFLILFANFYKQSYVKKHSKPSSGISNPLGMCMIQEKSVKIQ